MGGLVIQGVGGMTVVSSGARGDGLLVYKTHGRPDEGTSVGRGHVLPCGVVDGGDGGWGVIWRHEG